jgi:two-component system phosphate regulon sensor histidine kinase PhoR
LVLGVGAGVFTLYYQVTQEIRQARARSEFLAGISHDLRTPLSSMRMLSESLYLGSVKAPEKQQAFLGTIVSECDRLTQMINRALFFVRLGHGALVYSRRENDVAAVVMEAVELFRSRIAEDRAEIELDVSPGRYRASIDSDAMEQLLLNLLDNAVKYSPGKARVSLALTRTDNWIRLTVRDHGIGMTRAQRRRIFRQFYRTREAVGTAKGSGLGLSLCRHIVKGHGGRITVESSPGQGSTFTVSLPGDGVT